MSAQYCPLWGVREVSGGPLYVEQHGRALEANEWRHLGEEVLPENAAVLTVQCVNLQETLVHCHGQLSKH